MELDLKPRQPAFRAPGPKHARIGVSGVQSAVSVSLQIKWNKNIGHFNAS